MRTGGAPDVGIGADLFFGGGTYDHDRVAAGVRVGDQTHRVAEPIRLPPGLRAAAFPEPSVGGEPLLHPDGLWLGTALSSFGIVANRDLLVMLNVPAPTDWSDLTDPAWSGWLAAADPAHSGSIAAAFNAVLRRRGWTEGWGVLRRVFANARSFSGSASRVPTDVAVGEAAAGLCIDFYGRMQAQAVAADGWSGDPPGMPRTSRLTYADPARDGRSQTATTADPITLLRGAPRRDLAEAFVAWLLSPAGQRLWQLRPGVPGGPVFEALRRQPVRRDVYADRTHWTDPDAEPFATATPLPPGTPDFFAAVAPVSHALAIDVHDELRAAWASLRAMPPDHPHRAAALAAFDALPADLTAAPTPSGPDAGSLLAAWARRTPDDRLRDRQRWTAFFRDRYAEVVRLARAPAVPAARRAP